MIHVLCISFAIYETFKTLDFLCNLNYRYVIATTIESDQDKIPISIPIPIHHHYYCYLS